MIRIIIVDDEVLSRVGIRSFFDEERDIEVVRTFGMAAEAIIFLQKNKVDIVITDIEMADINARRTFCHVAGMQHFHGLTLNLMIADAISHDKNLTSRMGSFRVNS